jgi:hypothetical protein
MEVCEGCKYAVIHNCCGKFCHCEEGHEEKIDHSKGICPEKIEKEV